MTEEPFVSQNAEATDCPTTQSSDPMDMETEQLESMDRPVLQNFTMDMFDRGKSLGEANPGHVHQVKHRESGKTYALKTLTKIEIRSFKIDDRIRREVDVRSNVYHPSMLGFHGWFEDSDQLCLVLENVDGGDLYTKIEREGPLSEPQAAHYVVWLTEVLRFLHAKGVMHRDIKPENVFLDSKDKPRLAGFRHCVQDTSNRRMSLCGTLDYLPPEMLQKDRAPYSSAVDQWALGVFTYELLTGSAPFHDSLAVTQSRIRKMDMTPLPPTVSPEAKEFVLALLQLDPEQRMSLGTVLVHPWIVKNRNEN